jgi:hypothetical protein
MIYVRQFHKILEGKEDGLYAPFAPEISSEGRVRGLSISITRRSSDTYSRIIFRLRKANWQSDRLTEENYKKMIREYIWVSLGELGVNKSDISQARYNKIRKYYYGQFFEAEKRRQIEGFKKEKTINDLVRKDGSVTSLTVANTTGAVAFRVIHKRKLTRVRTVYTTKYVDQIKEHLVYISKLNNLTQGAVDEKTLQKIKTHYKKKIGALTDRGATLRT